jgi:hypothetical protein
MFKNAWQNALLILFSEIQRLDGCDDGVISRSEFRLLLQRLDIHFSDDRFEDAFLMLDINNDQCIGLKEFYEFLYPQAQVHFLKTAFGTKLFNFNFSGICNQARTPSHIYCVINTQYYGAASHT